MPKAKNSLQEKEGGKEERERGVISKPPIDEMDGWTFLFFPSHLLEGPWRGGGNTEGGRQELAEEVE